MALLTSPSRSKMPTIVISTVSLNALMLVLTRDGIEIASACGRITSRVLRQYPMPKASAASYWPRGITCRPPLMASAR